MINLSTANGGISIKMKTAKDVQVAIIAQDTKVFRARTWERLKFEIEYGLARGTTANSFLIEADKTALIDPPGESFTEIFLQTLQERIALTKIDYVILGHVNPNRAATLNALLQKAPNLTFVTSNPGAQSLQVIFQNSYSETIADRHLKIEIVKAGEKLDLGNNHLLEFIPTPNPRYPDQLLTYDPQTAILYSNKLFGAHICTDQIFDEGWSIYNEDRRYYFDCVIAPYATQISKALDKLKLKPAKVYATSHGPLVKYALNELTNHYQQWLNNQKSHRIFRPLF